MHAAYLVNGRKQAGSNTLLHISTLQAYKLELSPLRGDDTGAVGCAGAVAVELPPPWWRSLVPRAEPNAISHDSASVSDLSVSDSSKTSTCLSANIKAPEVWLDLRGRGPMKNSTITEVSSRM